MSALPMRWRRLVLTVWAVAGGLLLAAMLGFGLPVTVRGTGITDDAGNRRGPDFLTHYTAGRMVIAGEAARLYDLPVQAAAQEAALGSTLDRPSPFLLPPAAALLFAPFALFPFSAAITLWIVLSALLSLWALGLVWPLAPLRSWAPGPLVALAMLGSYPVGMNLVTGNNAALWLTVYALATRWLAGGQAVAAGLVLGLGALKPQLFLAAPVLLLAQRQWRALGAFAGMAALLGTLSLAMVGLEGSRHYAAILTSSAYREAVAIADAWRMLSLPAFIRAVVPNVPDPFWLIVAAGGLFLLGWATWRASAPLTCAAAIFVGVLIDPHCFLYDGMVLFVPILLRAGGTGWGASAWALAALWLLTWMTPFRSLPAPGTFAAVPWAVLPLAALAMAALRDARALTPSAEVRSSSGAGYG